jgi:hypothetical protein
MSKVVSLKHFRLRAQDAERDARNADCRDIETFADDIVKWWKRFPGTEQMPDFVYAAMEIQEMGVMKYLIEQCDRHLGIKLKFEFE